MERETDHDKEKCQKQLLPLADTMYLLGGKWKFHIIMALAGGVSRFKEISKSVEGISDKVLSKELKDLEINNIITRTEIDHFPPIVEYHLTEHGKSLQPVVNDLAAWGQKHRNKIVNGG